ncbi:MAG TPA: phosphatase PAP2 family protein [Actinocrinis sp.]|nr:phosphatase PAP2 family protein [Actinocrinis sp.]
MSSSPKAVDGRRGIAMRVVLTVAATLVLGAVMVGLGWLVVHPLAHLWPLSAEDAVDRTLAAHRDPGLNALTGDLSTVADTPCTVLLAAAAILGARRALHRWRESLFIAAALAIEPAVFLATTVFVHRPRPAGVELDHSPPTSSFPSGHTAAAVALYGALAWLIARQTRRAYAWCLLLMPAAVGFARLYRDMHHPSDVAAGLLLGMCALVIARRALLEPDPRAARTVARAAPARRGAVGAVPGGRR